MDLNTKNFMPKKFNAAEKAVAMRKAILYLIWVSPIIFNIKEFIKIFNNRVIKYSVEKYIKDFLRYDFLEKVNERFPKYANNVPATNPIPLAFSLLRVV